MEFVHILLSCVLSRTCISIKLVLFYRFYLDTYHHHPLRAMSSRGTWFVYCLVLLLQEIFLSVLHKILSKTEKKYYIYILGFCACADLEGVGDSHPLKTSYMLNLHSKIIGLGPPPLPRQTQLSLKHPSPLRKFFQCISSE